MVRNADLMVRQSVWPSLIAARLAALHLAPNGLLQFTGAATVPFIYIFAIVIANERLAERSEAVCSSIFFPLD